MKENRSIAALIIKIVVALLAVAGAVYVIVAFGDKIVAWFKKITAKLPFCKCGCTDCDFVEDDCDEGASADGVVVAEENEFEN